MIIYTSLISFWVNPYLRSVENDIDATEINKRWISKVVFDGTLEIEKDIRNVFFAILASCIYCNIGSFILTLLMKSLSRTRACSKYGMTSKDASAESNELCNE